MRCTAEQVQFKGSSRSPPNCEQADATLMQEARLRLRLTSPAGYGHMGADERGRRHGRGGPCGDCESAARQLRTLLP
jgi:hypothetical protein